MKPIDKLTVAGFRGILSPLELSFRNGATPTSMVIYGRNGTGKSSIADAWEWLHAGRIDRLAREGAREGAYPHREASQGDTFVEASFSGPRLKPARLTFDLSRVRTPKEEGDLQTLRRIAPHPCHIRFADLTDFVYYTKAQRHDALARLMGFTPQVELQKALRRTLRRLTDELESRKGRYEVLSDEINELLEPDDLTDSAFLARMNSVFSRHSVGSAKRPNEAETMAEILRNRVEEDPRAKELAELERLKRACEATVVPDHLWLKIEALEKSARELGEQAGKIADLPLVDLYGRVQRVLEERLSSEETTGKCPVCGQEIAEPLLLEHLKDELTRLEELKKAKDGVVTAREQLKQLLRDSSGFASNLVEHCSDLELPADAWSTEKVTESARAVEAAIDAFAPMLESPIGQLPEVISRSLSRRIEKARTAASDFESGRKSLLTSLTRRSDELRNDETRGKLVADYSLVRDALKARRQWAIARDAVERLQEVSRRFDRFVEAFVRDSIADVQARFAAISDDVDRFFGILEEHTQGVGSPALRLLPEQDRAVILEVEFRGETVSPAYRMLSESQLNSFGLAAFLASAKQFNPKFRFLILDDVINSFDAYKRPQVVRLLKEEFPDHQFLVMTHDETWANRLFEEFPQWVRRRFARYEPTGPVVDEALSDLEKIQARIDSDEATDAGRILGPFLERQLQELCEEFQALVKYNRRNEYTLRPLLERFRVRVTSKLGCTHPLTAAVEELESEQAFRNLCAHWQNPAAPMTPVEIQIVVNAWNRVERLVRCPEDACFGFLRYAGKGRFVCRCGRTALEGA